MRTSILLLSLATLLSALAAGCMPSGEGPIAFSPRTYPYVTNTLADPVNHK